MSEHTFKFDIAMSCGGCSGAVDRVLKKLDGTLPSPCPSQALYSPQNPPLLASLSPFYSHVLVAASLDEEGTMNMYL